MSLAAPFPQSSLRSRKGSETLMESVDLNPQFIPLIHCFDRSIGFKTTRPKLTDKILTHCNLGYWLLKNFLEDPTFIYRLNRQHVSNMILAICHYFHFCKIRDEMLLNRKCLDDNFSRRRAKVIENYRKVQLRDFKNKQEVVVQLISALLAHEKFGDKKVTTDPIRRVDVAMNCVCIQWKRAGMVVPENITKSEKIKKD